MDVEVLRSTTIPHAAPDAHPSETPLSIFDHLEYDFHYALLFVFSPPTAINARMIDGLAKTLAHFPTLTARLTTNARKVPCLLLGDGGGALVVEAAVKSSLSDHLPLEPSRDLWLLHPPLDGAAHLLQVQLNRFACGGLVMAATVHHHVADGQSISNFFVAWSNTVRGLGTVPLPVYDRSWLQPRRPPILEPEHWREEFMLGSTESLLDPEVAKIDVGQDRISNVLLHFSPDFIAALKARTPEEYTTFEALTGHLWRKISIARGLNSAQRTMAVVSVNGRPRIKPPVPTEFFGCLVLHAFARASVGEIVGGGIAEAARVVSEAVRGIRDESFRSMIDFGAMHGEQEELVPSYEMVGNLMSPLLDVASWLGFRFQEVDFGGGGALRAFMPSWMPAEGIVMLLPSLRGAGGIEAVVTLLQEHATLLKEISHSLD